MGRPSAVNGVQVPYGLPTAELARMAGSPGAAAWAAMEALAHDSTDGARDVLVTLARNADWRVRHAAVRALGRHALGVDAAAVVVGALDDRVQYVVRAACDSAAELGLMEARSAVHAQLGSADMATREAAVRAIEALWEPVDSAKLLEMFRSDPAPSVRRRAAWVLRRHASAANWFELFEAWVDDPLPRHRTWACEVVGDHGDARSLARVTELLDDQDGHVRKSARKALDANKG